MLRSRGMKSFFVILLVESFALSLGGACLLDFKNLDADQKSIHTILCKTATRLSKGSKNYFLPALSFVFEKERRSYILTKSLYKSKGTCFISNDTKNCTNNQLLQIHNMLSLIHVVPYKQ